MITLLTIGNELLDGRILNSNQQSIGQHLHNAGFTLTTCISVADDEKSLSNALLNTLKESRIIITTGGLGPTEDDKTTDILAKALNLPLVQSDDIMEKITRYYKHLDLPIPKTNLKQALIPKNAHLMGNKKGTAPGYHFTYENTHIFVCPGVPKEMLPMCKDDICPTLINNYPDLRNHQSTDIFKCIGIAESRCAELLEPYYPLPEGLTISYQVPFPEVHVRCHYDENFPKKSKDTLVKNILSKLKSACFAHNDTKNFTQTVVSTCLNQGLTLALAESCTGGRLAAEITSVPGASQVLDRSIITYSNQSKIDELNIDPNDISTHGAVSEKIAKKMAQHIQQKTGSNLAISITGIAGPDGGTDEKPVGTVFIALADKNEVQVKKIHALGDREKIQHKAVTEALLMIWEKTGN